MKMFHKDLVMEPGKFILAPEIILMYTQGYCGVGHWGKKGKIDILFVVFWKDI